MRRAIAMSVRRPLRSIVFALTALFCLGAGAAPPPPAKSGKADAPPPAPDLSAAPPADAGGPPPAAPTADSKGAAVPAATDAAPGASTDGGVEAPAGPPPVKATDDDFDAALNRHFKGDYVGAAAGFYYYLRGSARTADRYEWAEHFLSVDLDQLGFKQGAIRYEVAVTEERARPEVIPDALDHLEDLIGANPYDQDLIEDELLHGTDFGPLPARSRSFVSYYQGLVDYRQGHTKWGDKRFAKVDPDSRYAAKVLYLKAVYRMVHDKDDSGAKAGFMAIAADEKAPRELRNQARTAVARLDYEAKDFQGSYDMYNSVKLPELDPGRASVYLERAWNLYRLKKYGDAMGLLAAVDAPSFRDVFLPEKFLLRSLIYKDLCHYLPSKRSAREFSRRFSTTLKTIRARAPLEGDPKLVAAALQLDEEFGRSSAMRDSLNKEKELIGRYASPWERSGLGPELERVYGLLTSEGERNYQVARHAALKRAADVLLADEEQLRLEDYEVGLAMYQRYRRGRVVTEAPKPEVVDPEDVVYDFDGEYWNDELHSYHFFLTSRCLEQEGVK